MGHRASMTAVEMMDVVGGAGACSMSVSMWVRHESIPQVIDLLKTHMLPLRVGSTRAERWGEQRGAACWHPSHLARRL